MDRETIDGTQKGIARILIKMEKADMDFCTSIRSGGGNYFIEFAREYFGEYMKPIELPGDYPGEQGETVKETILEPTPDTERVDWFGKPRKRIPKEVKINGVMFTRTEVQTCIRLSNIHFDN